MGYLPIFLDLSGKSAIVVGKSSAAEAKARQLADAGAVVCRMDDAQSVAGAAVVICADADRAKCARIAQMARASGIPVNVVDEPELCDFIWPAIVDRSPVIVAISTGGASPVLAQILRARIEALLPATIGRLAQFAHQLRSRIARAVPDPAARRQFWRRVLDGPVGNLVLAGREENAAREVDRELLQAGSHRGHVSIIDARVDTDMLSLKALRRLQEADVLFLDHGVESVSSALARRDAVRMVIDGSEWTGKSFHRELARQISTMVAAERKVVCFQSGGRSGGLEFSPLAMALAGAGVPYEITPVAGVSFEPRPSVGPASHFS